MLGYFPVEEHAQARVRVAQNLMAVVSLRLLTSVNGGGRQPAVEVMLVTRSVEIFIRNPEKTPEIHNYIQKSHEMGVQTFDQHLVELLQAGKISMESAKLAATNPAKMQS